MKQIEAIVFDLGNVLVSVDWTLAAGKFCHYTGKTWDDLKSFADGGDVMDRFARGELQPQEFYELAVKQIGFRGEYRLFNRAFCGIFSPIQPMLSMAMALEGRIRRYLLSNTNIMHMERLLASHPMLRRFDGHVLSYVEGMLKPDRAIFELTRDRFGLDPSATVYIDDLAQNCASAATVGFRVIHHTNPEITLRELTKLGVPVI